MSDFIKEQSGRYLYRLANTLEAPDYAKEASVIEEDVQGLPDAAFGRPHLREFPLDTPGHVWLSHGFVKAAGVRDPILEEKIKQAGALFGITEDLAKIDQAFSQLTKQASHDRYYAITIDFGQEDDAKKSTATKQAGMQGFYPITTATELENSAVKLVNDRKKIPLELFADGCRNIVKRAGELKVANNYLPQTVLRYGVERLPDPWIVKCAAELRTEITKDPIYQELAEAALAQPESSYDFAELWLQADRMNGVKMGRFDPDPFEIMNSGQTKEEAEKFIESWVSIAEAPVPREKVAAVTEADLRKRFQKDTADKLLLLVKKAGTTDGSVLTNDFAALDKATQVSFVKFLMAA